MEVLSNIPIKLDLETVLKQICIRNTSKDIKKTIQGLLEMINPIAKPKAVYEISCVNNREGDSLDIGGVRFTSHVLRVNLEKLEKVFPYVVTCGRELDEIEIPQHQLMEYYFLDQIKEIIVRLALSYLHDYIKKNYAC